MSATQLDCRGLACPSPVLKTKEIVDRGVERLSVLVDNDAARENVSRFLERQGYGVIQEMQDGAFVVTGVRLDQVADILQTPKREAPRREAAGPQKILVLLAADRLGRGDDELGAKLAENFLATLREMGGDLWRLVLLNSGVKLAVSGSPVVSRLQELAETGVSLLVCGTCLNHFGLLDAKLVGETTNMLDIVTSLQLADKVISLT